MLQGLVEGLGSNVQGLTTWGTQFWQDTACASPFIQNYIGWCPPPVICQYVPEFMLGTCKAVVSTLSDNYASVVESLDSTTAIYSSIAVASAYFSWYLYQQTQVAQQKQLEMTQEMLLAFQEASKQIVEIHAQLVELSTKIGELTPKEADTKIDAIKRARAQLMAYMKQAGVSDIFYGDRIREMGLEILSKHKEGRELFHNPMQVIELEEKRLDNLLEAKKEEQSQRRAKSPAFALHVEKDSAVIARAKLLNEIEARGAQKAASSSTGNVARPS